MVELLDALKIETAAVLGHSAGGPPAAHFALRHPERCLGLALLSAVLPPPYARLVRSIWSMRVWKAWFSKPRTVRGRAKTFVAWSIIRGACAR